MTYNLEFSRIMRLLTEINDEAHNAPVVKGTLTGTEPVSVQLVCKFHADPHYITFLGSMLSGFMMLPHEAVSTLIALGHRMGVEDARLAGETDELQKLYNLPTGEEKIG